MLTISAAQEVTIEDDVMFALNVLISDGMHGFENANEPYKYQKMWKVAPVLVKRGCWIGQNVVIMPGVTVGELSIIGANSVVTKSIPDRCIAIGAPARVVKTWDEHTQAWIPAGKAT
jgi:acetyltransferase-like isoleucine patch superfamily enzyme